MARNEEKSHSVLNRWLALQTGELGKKKAKRPHLASLVDSLDEAERWRRDCLKDIGVKVMQIQNESLDEFRVRDLNDEINRLMREKTHWERRIRELGGPDYARTSVKSLDDDAIIGAGGYIYFGAARKLPGVQELVRPGEGVSKNRTRHELYQHIDAEYYGYKDSEDGALEKLEEEAEAQAVKEALEEWKQSQILKGVDPEALLKSMGSDVSSAKRAKTTESFVSHVENVPDRADMEKLVVEARKQELLKRYMSEGNDDNMQVS